MAAADYLATVEVLQDAAQENKLSSFRRGQTVWLPSEGEVFMSGDIHDHRKNLAKLIAVADLGNHPERHIVLHELIHGDHYDDTGAEDSWHSLVKAAELKLDYPEQVHFLLANHDLAQIHGEGISKGGASVCEAFNKGVKRDFAPDHGKVQSALTEFLLSFPLAVRNESHLFFSHSVPNEDQVETFDYSVFDREELEGKDYAKRVGPVYQLIWGRRTSPEGVAKFLGKVNAKAIVTGHQPQDMGYAQNGEQHVIIASDHNHGCFIPLKLGRDYTADEVVGLIEKFVGVELGE
jgi:hypothetical protein